MCIQNEFIGQQLASLRKTLTAIVAEIDNIETAPEVSELSSVLSPYGNWSEAMTDEELATTLHTIARARATSLERLTAIERLRLDDLARDISNVNTSFALITNPAEDEQRRRKDQRRTQQERTERVRAFEREEAAKAAEMERKRFGLLPHEPIPSEFEDYDGTGRIN